MLFTSLNGTLRLIDSPIVAMFLMNPVRIAAEIGKVVDLASRSVTTFLVSEKASHTVRHNAIEPRWTLSRIDDDGKLAVVFSVMVCRKRDGHTNLPDEDQSYDSHEDAGQTL